MRLTYTLLVVSLHKINKLVCFAAPLNTRQAYDLRQSFHKSFYSVAGRAARATFDALAASGVNAQLERQTLSKVGSPICERVRKNIVDNFKNNVHQRQIAKALQISSYTVHIIIKRFRETGEISVRKGQG